MVADLPGGARPAGPSGSSTATEPPVGADTASTPHVTRSPARDAGHAPRSRRRLLGWLLIATGVALLAGTAWVGWRTYQAYSHLTAASAAVSELRSQLENASELDPAAAAATVGELQAESAAAAAAVGDPLYRLATVVPGVGPNLRAISEISYAVDSLATEVLPSMVDIAQSVQPSALAPRGGSIDLRPIAQASTALQLADAAVGRSRTAVASLDRSALVTPVFEAVDSLDTKLDAAASVISTAARAARLLPPMLGADYPRHYLVAFQNLAEPRATGGIFGSYALVKVDNGTFTMVDGAASRTLGRFDPASADLSPDQLALYTAEIARFPQDVNFTPDFSVAAPLFAGMYTTRTGTAVDGVVAIDPVAVSYMLDGTGPVDAGGGVILTSDTVVPVLLSTAYEQFEDGGSQTLRDEFLAGASARAFGAVMSGQGNPAKVMKGLSRAASERRVLLWSADGAEQADLAATQLAGVPSTDVSTPTIGVFLNDGTGAKLGYYLRNEVRVVPGECRADGTRELDVAVTLNYDAPSSGLPDYVTGPGAADESSGITPYDLRTNVLVFAPVGGSITGQLTRDGVAGSLQVGSDRSRPVGISTVTMSPGSSTELVFTITTPAADKQTPVVPRLELTPGVAAWKSEPGSYRGCSM